MKKVVIATDIHGSAKMGKAVIDAFYKECADKLVLLGDVYYHGPRNPLPCGHGPMELCEALNAIKDDIICVRGNCDADVDLMISDFEFLSPITIEVGGKKLLLTHGHEGASVPSDADVVLRGHFHVNSEEVVGGKKVLGLSSASLPKGGCEACYAVVENGAVTYKRLSDGQTINVIKL